MKMIDYLDRDRDRILAGLKGAHSPAEAQQFLEKETDRVLGSKFGRQAALLRA